MSSGTLRLVQLSSQSSSSLLCSRTSLFSRSPSLAALAATAAGPSSHHQRHVVASLSTTATGSRIVSDEATQRNNNRWNHGQATKAKRAIRMMSTDGNDTLPTTPFRPRRKPSASYRPIQPAAASAKLTKKERREQINLDGDQVDAVDMFGPETAHMIESLRWQHHLETQDPNYLETTDLVEDELRAADYLTAEYGSTEERIFERRAMERFSEEERKAFYKQLDEILKEAEEMNIEDMMDDSYNDLLPYNKNTATPAQLIGMTEATDDMEDEDVSEDVDPETTFDLTQRAHGEWSELLVSVNRSVRLWRGGRLESYRALMIAGNCNGCGGFGIGKSPDPMKAVDLAGKMAKRNIFFVDRYQGNGLTRDLVGKMNSTKVVIRSTDNGLRGNELCTEILKRFGITNAVAKAHGNRHPWNVVRATFKALLTHESLEDIALKRGRRIVSLDRAMRMQV